MTFSLEMMNDVINDHREWNEALYMDVIVEGAIYQRKGLPCQDSKRL